MFLVGSVVLLTMMVTFLGIVLFLLLLRLVKILNFMISCEWTRDTGQDACSGMAGFLCFLGFNGAPPWAVDASESAAYLVEVALGRFSSGMLSEWSPSDEFDHDVAVSSLPDHPDVWTDGSLVLDRLTGVSSAGSGIFAHQAEHFWGGRWWGHVDGVRIDPSIASCRSFCSVPGPICSEG